MAFIPAASFPPHFHKADGSLAVGCVLAVFEANSSTPTDLYLDEAGNEAGTSFTLNDRGEIEVSGNSIVPWLDTETTYKFVLTDPDDGQQWNVDDIITPVRQATESYPGIVQLYDDIDSTDSTLAATANALRIVAELAQQAITIAQAGLPVGAPLFWPTNTPPDETWQEENGGSLLVAEYPELFALLGYKYGGSGANFNKRDMRGRFPRGWDHGAGRDPDAATRTNRGDGVTGDDVGTLQEDTLQNITGTFGGQRATGGFSTGAFTNGFDGSANGDLGGSGNKASYSFDASRVVRTSTETRPDNISGMWIMKVKSTLD